MRIKGSDGGRHAQHVGQHHLSCPHLRQDLITILMRIARDLGKNFSLILVEPDDCGGFRRNMDITAIRWLLIGCRFAHNSRQIRKTGSYANMAKNLSDRIAARYKAKPLSTASRNRAAFLAVRPEVKTALKDGWRMVQIWETLVAEKQLSFGYDTFTRYVNKLIKEPATEPAKVDKPETVALLAPSKSKVPVRQPVNIDPSKPAQNTSMPDFRFNPNPKKEDLL